LIKKLCNLILITVLFVSQNFGYDYSLGVTVLDQLYFIIQGADKSLALPGRKQAAATDGFEFHIFYL
jgi:hypothetical protein